MANIGGSGASSSPMLQRLPRQDRQCRKRCIFIAPIMAAARIMAKLVLFVAAFVQLRPPRQPSHTSGRSNPRANGPIRARSAANVIFRCATCVVRPAGAAGRPQRGCRTSIGPALFSKEAPDCPAKGPRALCRLQTWRAPTNGAPPRRRSAVQCGSRWRRSPAPCTGRN